jgi:predicted dehydrogenase
MKYIGIIGMGVIGQKYYNIINEGKVFNASVGGICKSSTGKNDSSYRIWEFKDYRSLIDIGRYDAIIVTTPHASHYEIGKYSLLAGLPTLIDKPMAMNRTQYSELIKLGAVTCFNSRMEGKITANSSVFWSVNWYKPTSYYVGWRKDYDSILWNQSIHNLDLLQWSFGNPHIIKHESDKHNVKCTMQFGDIGVEYIASTNNKTLPTKLIIDGVECKNRKTGNHQSLLQQFVDGTLERPSINTFDLIRSLA